MRLPNAVRLVAIAMLALSACGDPPAQTSGDGDGDAGEDEAPPQEGICGDGLVNAEQEACDDANDREGDGCNSDCRASGERVWCLDDFGPADVDTTPTALAVGPSGDVAVVGTISEGGGVFTGWLEVVDASGAPRWSTSFENSGGRGVVFFSDGTLAVAIHEAGSTSSSIALFSAEGTPGIRWTGESGQKIQSGAFVVSPQSSLIAAGEAEDPDEAWIGTFSDELDLEQQAAYRSSRGLSTSGRAVAISPAGNIILGADVVLEPGTDFAGPRMAAAIAEVLPSGAVAWEHVFEVPNRSIHLASIAVMTDGSVVATGEAGLILGFYVWTASLTATGEVSWELAEEGEYQPSSGTSVASTSTPDFLLTSVVSREAPYAFEAVFGRYDHEHMMLWEHEYEHSGHGASAMLSARSSQDRSFLLAGILIPTGFEGPERPWLCKYTE